MNLQQFQYVLAVVDSNNFESAAEKCFVTQSTLSTMINKFEGEIGIRIFNRKTKPVSITPEGEQIVKRLRVIVKEIENFENTVQEIKGELSGNLNIGIIPTIAPYLLPLIVEKFSSLFPKLNISIKEMTTAQIEEAIKIRELDIGVLAIPLKNKHLKEYSLYHEPFLLFDCSHNSKQKHPKIEDLDYSKLCLLEEGHCLRTQVYKLCELTHGHQNETSNYKFESGSMESLISITKATKGLTILPYLSTLSMKQNQIKTFEEPIPVREVGLVTSIHYSREAIVQGLIKVIKEKVEAHLPNEKKLLSIVEPID